MIRQRVVGAIRYPAFLAIWTAGVVAVTAQLQAIEASPAAAFGGAVTDADRFAAVVLDPAPRLDDRDAWHEAIAEAMKRTEVTSGAWQPRRGRPAPAIVPDVALGAVQSGTADSKIRQPADPVIVAPDRAAAQDVAAAPDWKTPAVGAGAGLRPASEREVDRDRLQRDKAAARTALRAGRFAEAYALLRPVVAEACRDAEFLGLLALAAVRIGSDGEALVLYRHLADLEPERRRWRLGLALAQQRLGLEPDGPAAAALAALSRAPDSGEGDLG